ncbi:MAG: AAA family ATPase [Candidatus Diapherotrites archaeon]
MIRRIVLENWRSHKHTELEFGPGTNVLVGRMGSGKSSVMNAICFALFGSFPELQRKEARIEDTIMEKPSQMEEASVLLEFDYGGKNYKVERKIYKGQKASMAKVYENGEFRAGPKVGEANECIEKILEIDLDLFSRAVYSEQNQLDFFIKMNASERKQKFDELLGLNRYEEVRKNAVTVTNTMKRLSEEKKKFLEEQEKGTDPKELETLKSEIRNAEEKTRQKQAEKTALEKELSDIEKTAKNLAEKKEKFNALKEKIVSLKQEIESIEREIKKTETETGILLEQAKETETREKPEKIREQIKKLKEQQKEASRLESEIASLKAKKESIEEENASAKKSLPEKASSKEGLLKELSEINKKKKTLEEKEKELKERLEELKKKEKEAGEEISILESNESEEQAILEKIGQKEECPLCKRPLTKNARQDLEKRIATLIEGLNADKLKAMQKLDSAKKEREKTETEMEKISKEKSALIELTAFLESLRTPLKRLEENTERENDITSKLIALEKQLKELKAENIEEEIEKLDKELAKAEKIIEGIKKRKEHNQKTTELEEAEKNLASLGFDEEKAMELERKIGEKTKAVEAIDTEIKGLLELIEEKKKRESEMNARIELIKNTKKSLENLEFAILKTTVFVNALKAAQAELRESLVETINEAMNIVWKRLYPYGDYESARMQISEGNYELEVLTRNQKWEKIEGILSGGERSSVALTLRIAFSLVLARNLGILILDEPTHNLDSNAISKLAEMLHNRLEGLVDQVFLITHNTEMEKAASASLYLLEREKEKDGITRVQTLAPIEE